MLTLDELIRQAAVEKPLAVAELIDAFCERWQLPFVELSERFARQVATSYQEGSLDWSDADAAMNTLFAQAALRSKDTWLSDFAFSVYLAFDAGEYHPKSPHLSADAVSRSLIDALLPDHVSGR